MRKLLACALLALASCAAPNMPVSVADTSLMLVEPAERVATFGINQRVRIPAGEYRPVLKDDNGTYYMPPGEIIGAFNLVLTDQRLYVAKDGRNALWTVGGYLNWLDQPLPLKTADKR